MRPLHDFCCFPSAAAVSWHIPWLSEDSLDLLGFGWGWRHCAQKGEAVNFQCACNMTPSIALIQPNAGCKVRGLCSNGKDKLCMSTMKEGRHFQLEFVYVYWFLQERELVTQAFSELNSTHRMLSRVNLLSKNIDSWIKLSTGELPVILSIERLKTFESFQVWKRENCLLAWLEWESSACSGGGKEPFLSFCNH